MYAYIEFSEINAANKSEKISSRVFRAVGGDLGRFVESHYNQQRRKNLFPRKMVKEEKHMRIISGGHNISKQTI